ncbi:hypothetical protein C8R45DRAFT_1100891 [Mycena sanguinolenta]|nr:hypothetical protein C8R45DRAFT_1100891 [Mycena sanguinolenta]
MGNSPSKPPSSLLFFTLSLIPSNVLRYPALVFAAISVIVYSIYRNPLAAKLTQVNDVIVMVDGILTQAKAECMRDHLLLAEYETRLLRTKLSASKIHSDLLELDATAWKRYLQNIMAISRGLAKCERELRDIERSLLLLIEAAHQRKLAEDLNLNTEIVNGSAFLGLFVERNFVKPPLYQYILKDSELMGVFFVFCLILIGFGVRIGTSIPNSCTCQAPLKWQSFKLFLSRRAPSLCRPKHLLLWLFVLPRPLPVALPFGRPPLPWHAQPQPEQFQRRVHLVIAWFLPSHFPSSLFPSRASSPARNLRFISTRPTLVGGLLNSASPKTLLRDNPERVDKSNQAARLCAHCGPAVHGGSDRAAAVTVPHGVSNVYPAVAACGGAIVRFKRVGEREELRLRVVMLVPDYHDRFYPSYGDGGFLFLTTLTPPATPRSTASTLPHS